MAFFGETDKKIDKLAQDVMRLWPDEERDTLGFSTTELLKFLCKVVEGEDPLLNCLGEGEGGSGAHALLLVLVDMVKKGQWKFKNIREGEDKKDVRTTLFFEVERERLPHGWEALSLDVSLGQIGVVGFTEDGCDYGLMFMMIPKGYLDEMDSYTMPLKVRGSSFTRECHRDKAGRVTAIDEKMAGPTRGGGYSSYRSHAERVGTIDVKVAFGLLGVEYSVFCVKS